MATPGLTLPFPVGMVLLVLLGQPPVTGRDMTLKPLKRKRIKDLITIKNKSAEAADGSENGGAEMSQDINSVDLIVRREIEALIAVPLIEAYIEVLGNEKARDVARDVIKNLAIEAGKMLKLFAGGDTMEHLQKALPLFAQGGALEFDIIETTDRHAAVNVTRCKFAEMYKKHGLEEYGFLLGCGRDYALMEGFNPDIKFTRTRTIMEGAEFCDFRFEQKK